MEIEKQSVVVLTYKIEPRFACMLKSVVWYLYCACSVPELFRKYRPYLFSTYVQRKINSLIIITNFLINNKFNNNDNNISIKKIFYFIWLPLKIVKPNIGTAPSSRLSVRMSVTYYTASEHTSPTPNAHFDLNAGVLVSTRPARLDQPTKHNQFDGNHAAWRCCRTVRCSNVKIINVYKQISRRYRNKYALPWIKSKTLC